MINFGRNHALFVLFLQFLCFQLLAQGPMDEGFKYLEMGQLKEAENFFEAYLEDAPQNRTANICYARAIGLQGRAVDSEKIFDSLDQSHPDDYEIGLNLAECYMWQKRYSTAKQKYQALLRNDPRNFVANLGYSNALSALKYYRLSKLSIDRTLEISPDNPSAKISKKYIYLAYADSLRTSADYTNAELVLNQLNSEYPLDRDVPLNRAVLYLTSDQGKKAQNVYQEMADAHIDDVEANLGLSYTSILLGRRKDALVYARLAEDALPAESDIQLKQRVGLSMVDALAFNKEWDENQGMIDSLKVSYGATKSLELADARRFVWKGQLQEGVRRYEALKLKDNSDPMVYLGLAETFNAQGLTYEANENSQWALKLMGKNPDALRLNQRIKDGRKAKFSLNMFNAEDSGENQTSFIGGTYHFPMYNNFRPYATLSYRRAHFGVLNTSSFLTQFGAGLIYQINHRFHIDGSIGKSFSSPNPEDSDNNNIADFLLGTRVNEKLSFDLFFKRELHTYTVDLIANNIAMNHFGLNLNLVFPNGIGLYAQLMKTTQTDDNKRNLIFTSLYYNLKEQPSVKIGANFSQLSYDFDRGALYFSPDVFRSLEAFAEMQNVYVERDRWLYKFFIAFGRQNIEVQESQLTRRIELELGRRFNRRSNLMMYYNYSNAAQSTITGFSFNMFGLRLNHGF